MTDLAPNDPCAPPDAPEPYSPEEARALRYSQEIQRLRVALAECRDLCAKGFAESARCRAESALTKPADGWTRTTPTADGHYWFRASPKSATMLLTIREGQFVYHEAIIAHLPYDNQFARIHPPQ